MSLSFVAQASSSSNADDGSPFADMTYDTVFRNVFNDREVLLGFLNAVKAAGEGVTIKEINHVERPGWHDVRGVIYDSLFCLLCMPYPTTWFVSETKLLIRGYSIQSN